MGGERDVGLVRAVGPWGLSASIISMMIGAGIFAVPSGLAASLGSYAPLAFIACSLGIGAVGICCAEGGSRIPTSGGIYGYIEASLGPLAGYISGTLLWVGDVLAVGGVAAALGDVAASLVPAALLGAVRVAVIIVVVGGIALVNLSGVARGARLVTVTTALKLLPLAIFVVAGATAMHGANFSPPPAWNIEGLGRALILATFALIGMETSLCASGEVARPSRTIPLALAIALTSVTALYAIIQLIVQGVLGSALPESAAPLADAMGRVSPALRMVMLAGTTFALLGMIAADILGTPRVLFAFARDGLLPRVLGRIHTRTHTPHVAILTYTAIALVLALTGTFAELAVLATLATAGLYIAACIAAWLLARRRVALAGEPLNFRYLGPAMVLGVISMLLVIALASRPEIIGLLALVVTSSAVYLLQARVARALASST
ncbi:MAG TPA: amino acid permease [Steroidobacteraceae bacterium]|jgi:amino acid transporter